MGELNTSTLGIVGIDCDEYKENLIFPSLRLYNNSGAWRSFVGFKDDYHDIRSNRDSSGSPRIDYSKWERKDVNLVIVNTNVTDRVDRMKKLVEGVCGGYREVDKDVGVISFCNKTWSSSYRWICREAGSDAHIYSGDEKSIEDLAGAIGFLVNIRV